MVPFLRSQIWPKKIPNCEVKELVLSLGQGDEMKLSKSADLSSMRLRARYTTETTVKVHAMENKVNSFININSIHMTLCMGGGGVL